MESLLLSPIFLPISLFFLSIFCCSSSFSIFPWPLSWAFFSSHFIEFSTYLSSQESPVCLWLLNLCLYRFNIFNSQYPLDISWVPYSLLFLLLPSCASVCLLPFPWMASQSTHSGIQARTVWCFSLSPQIHSVTKFYKLSFINFTPVPPLFTSPFLLPWFRFSSSYLDCNLTGVLVSKLTAFQTIFYSYQRDISKRNKNMTRFISLIKALQ